MVKQLVREMLQLLRYAALFIIWLSLLGLCNVEAGGKTWRVCIPSWRH